MLTRWCIFISFALLVLGCSRSSVPDYTNSYVLPDGPGVELRIIMTVGDSVNLKPDSDEPYRLCGYTDGLGAFDNNDGTFTLLIDHEIRPKKGIVRAHGFKGAFISKWIIDKKTLKPTHGEDHIKQTLVWDREKNVYRVGKKPLNRLCSADIPEASALYDSATDTGTKETIFFSGEEIHDDYGNGEGRAFAHIVTGQDAGSSFELPRLGLLSHENVLMRPYAGQKTVAVLLDDANNKKNPEESVGQVYVYIGQKQKEGNDVEKAGLNNGRLYGVRINGFAREKREDGIHDQSLRFDLVEVPSPEKLSGVKLEKRGKELGVTDFNRPEDGAWNPTSARDFYFATTDRYDSKTKDTNYVPLVKRGKHPVPANQVGRSRLWQLRFDDPEEPERGGTITAVLDGREEHQSLDNLCIEKNGRYIMLQEDPGFVYALARIWKYDIREDKLTLVAHTNPEYFTGSRDTVLTYDEETSGIIDASNILGPGWFLLAAQAHYNNKDRELVQGGQMLAMRVPLLGK